MEKDTVDRAALGSIACIGDLYDARRDNFCGISIFKKRVPQDSLSVVDSPFSDIHLVHTDDFSEKFSKLEVKAELQVSVLAGLFTLEGSGRYLSDQKKSARTVKSSLIYNIKTKEEKVNVYHEDLKDRFAYSAIESGVATHVVVGISWGANSVLSCQYVNNDNKDAKEIEGNMSATLKKMSLSISGKASVDFNEGDNNTGESFDVRIYGDILPKNEELPTTFQGALSLMKQLPKLVENYNGGKGKPLAYRLLPIALLKDHLNFQMKVKTTLKSLEEASLIRVVQLFDQLASSQQQLHDFQQDTINFRFCVPDEDVRKIANLKDSMKIQETCLRSKLSSVLTAVRSGKSDSTDLENLILEFQNSDLSPHKVSTLLTTWGSLIEKIKFARTLVQNGAKYVGFGISFDDEILKDFDKKTYAMFFTQNSGAKDGDQWKGSRQLFFQELKKKNKDCQYFAVDCDIHPCLIPKGCTSCIQVLQSGRVLQEDLLKEHIKMANVPWARATIGAVRLLHPPNKRVPLSIPCTGNHCNPREIHNWICKRCGQPLEYGFDSYVYCSCGKSPASCLEFKCPDPRHGLNFECHEDTKYLEQLLGQLRPFKEMNILILGETGVGKSTWINGFINYLTYESLEDAESGELLTLIPSEFTICRRTPQGVKKDVVRTGIDENEVFTQGHSSTQSSKVYPFRLGNTTVRLIDTPGIGDSRGYEQDKKNFQNILSTLSYHKEIHGICILLKPNDAILTVMFRFCIKELLTYLHRDATKNIVFCFTNSRGTGYEPGDTFTTLQALLSENKEVQIELCLNTMYCYDSEAYRYLAAMKNDPPVHLVGKEFYAKSWEMSVIETKRMLKHIRSLEPHPIQNTLNLNHAREMVLKLTRPLAEISRNIQTNKANLKQEREEIEKTEESIKELKKKRFTTITEIESQPLDHPKTVCAHGDCAKVWKIEGVTTKEYVKVCHNPCTLTDIPRDSLGDPGLLNCWALHETEGNQCRVCGHGYKNHLHVYYDSVQKPRKVEDQAVKESLEKNLTAAQMKEKMIYERNRKIADFEAEQKEIEKGSAKFAYFLRHNAITPYNDGMKDYLEHLIREEKDKIKQGGSPDALKFLESSLASYLKEKEILDREMSKGRSDDGEMMKVLDPKAIEQLVDKLKRLELTGASLKDALECVDKTRMGVYRAVVVSSQLGRIGKKSGQNIGGVWEYTKAKTKGFYEGFIGFKGLF